MTNGSALRESILSLISKRPLNIVVYFTQDYGLDSLKAEQTKCKTILNLKHDKAKIYAHNYTFEKAFYGDSVSSRIKTKTIFDILNYEETDSKDYAIREDILKTFIVIFELGIEDLQTDDINNKVIEIISEDNITNQFKDLIKDESMVVISN